jgi:aryl-alcohol dehydrogenase-like predicted oxidoreductase
MIKIGKAHNVSAAQVALAWLLKKPAVTSIIIGAKREDQLNDNLASAGLMLEDAEIKQLDDISALVPEYPGWMMARQTQDRLG